VDGSVDGAPRSTLPGGIGLLVALSLAVVIVGLWHLTQGTSSIGAGDLLRALAGQDISVGGVSAADIFTGSRLPRLLAGVAVGFSLGVAGCLLQSITRNQLASPDTLAVSAGAYFSLTAVAAFGIAVPLWASGAVAFVGGLLAAAVVLGRSSPDPPSRWPSTPARRCSSSSSARTRRASSPGAAARSAS
jgi:iron complex transport system permease protein